jgi:uncharacterized membrane protein YvlD (DUF360 family)
MSSADELAAAPLALPVERPSNSWKILRVLIVAIAQALTLLLAAWLLPSFSIDRVESAIAMVIALAVLNGFFWPVVVRVVLPIILLTLGLFTFVLNAIFLWAAAAIVGGVQLSSFWAAMTIALMLTVVNLVVGGILDIDGDNSWRRTVVRRITKRVEPPPASHEPGFLFIQIDGLGHDVLEAAMANGHAPFLARLVASGTHQLHSWECDLSSQTGAMQAGILLGDNHNMPAFRWYEKTSGKVMVTNRPNDAAEIEARQSSGVGLLVGGGASRTNVFSGDTDDTMLTFSTVGDKDAKSDRFLYVISTPYALFRIIALSIVDIGRELRAARRARRDGAEPRLGRRGVYPLLRAATTVVLAEITWSILVADVTRGVPAAYIDLVGYDEVAHHSGIAAPDTLDTLRRTDDALERFLTVLDDAPRPYYLVVLADHGQTQGATFKQRYGETLDEVIQRLAEGQVGAPVLAEEGWNNVNGLLTDAAYEDSTAGKVVERATRRVTKDGGEVEVGPTTATELHDDVIVLASGNLGLVSFTGIDGRANIQQIEGAQPGLLEGLRRHEGVGLILVRDDELGDVVLGPRGVHHLADGRVEGDDPLAVFGPNTADHLRRTSSFDNCPDLLINSFYDPTADEGAAFEELIGFHGGLGGRQSHPFVLAPAGLPQPSAPLVGARSIYDLFKEWIDVTQGSETDRSAG